MNFHRERVQMSNVSEIVTQLKIARKFYYDGKPILTDPQFDQLEAKLRELDPDNDYFATVGTPATRGIKVKHRIPMGSLDQMDQTLEIARWSLGVNDTFWIASHKLDGNSIALYYDEDGQFESAVTRGDGIEGLDVTRHFRRILATRKDAIPLKFYPNGTVRAEVIMTPAAFKEHVTGYKNPRNYVAGQLNRTVSDQVFIDHVDVIAFDADADYYNTTKYSKDDILSNLEYCGFKTVEYLIIEGNIPDSDELTKILEDSKQESAYELDGVVVEANNFAVRKHVGFLNLNPRYAFKFKINQNFVETEVQGVHWRASKDGYLKPRVEFDPVDLAGVTITFATGFNAKFIHDNNIGPGAVIRVTRSGDVIPFIESVIKQAQGPNMPLEEEVGSFHWSETNVDLILDELPDSSRILEAVDFFSSIDAPLLKEGNVTKLFEAGFDSISSIIKASEDDMVVVLGENGSKVYLGLKDKLTDIEEYVLVGSLPFVGRGVGKRKMKKLAEAYGSLEGLTKEQIVAVDGFEDKTVSKISHGLILYKRFILDHSDYISVVKFERKTGDLTDISVCFTGVRSKDLENIIENRGGKIASSVSKDCTHLVAKDPNGKSSKLDKARKQGVKVISLEEAQTLWSN